MGAGKRDTGCRVFEILRDTLHGPEKSDNLKTFLEAGTVSLCQLGHKLDLGTSLSGIGTGMGCVTHTLLQVAFLPFLVPFHLPGGPELV